MAREGGPSAGRDGRAPPAPGARNATSQRSVRSPRGAASERDGNAGGPARGAQGAAARRRAFRVFWLTAGLSARQRARRERRELAVLRVYDEVVGVDARGKPFMEKTWRSRLSKGLGSGLAERLAGVLDAGPQAAPGDASGADGTGAADGVAPPAMFAAARACVARSSNLAC